MIYRLMFKTYKRFLNLNLRSNYLKSPFDKKGVSEEYLRTGYVNSLIDERINSACSDKRDQILDIILLVL